MDSLMAATSAEEGEEEEAVGGSIGRCKDGSEDGGESGSCLSSISRITEGDWLASSLGPSTGDASKDAADAVDADVFAVEADADAFVVEADAFVVEADASALKTTVCAGCDGRCRGS